MIYQRLIAFVWAIREGYKIDILNIAIGLAFIGYPFMAAAFVANTKKDADRLIVNYLY